MLCCLWGICCYEECYCYCCRYKECCLCCGGCGVFVVMKNVIVVVIVVVVDVTKNFISKENLWSNERKANNENDNKNTKEENPLKRKMRKLTIDTLPTLHRHTFSHLRPRFPQFILIEKFTSTKTQKLEGEKVGKDSGNFYL
jgi:hypothetical protein